MKIYITAQAQRKSEMMSDIHSKSRVIVNHIFKLVVMPNNSARNHWQGEIAGQLNRIPSLKGSNKFPTKETLLKWVYFDIEDEINNSNIIEDDLDNIYYDYGENYNGTIDELINRFNTVCYEYFYWLTGELSKYGRVLNRDIYRKLDELL